MDVSARRKKKRSLSRGASAAVLLLLALAVTCRSGGSPCTEIAFIEQGVYSSAHIGVGRDGLPYLLLLDDTSIVFLHCEDAGCRKTTRKVLADGVEPAGVSLAGSEREALPRLSFREAGGGREPVALRCQDERCSATIASDLITTERRPCERESELVRWKCDGPACRERSRSVIAEKIGERAAVVESANGVWIFDPSGSSVSIRRCGAQRCEEGKSIAVTGTAHLLTGMTAANDSVWLAVLDDSGLRIALCRYGQCAERAASPQAAGANAFAMLNIGPDGLPVVFLSNPNRLIRCADARCSRLAEQPLEAGLIYSLTIDSGGYPLFVADGGNRTVRVLRCTDPACSATTAVTIPLH